MGFTDELSLAKQFDAIAQLLSGNPKRMDTLNGRVSFCRIESVPPFAQRVVRAFPKPLHTFRFFSGIS